MPQPLSWSKDPLQKPLLAKALGKSLKRDAFELMREVQLICSNAVVGSGRDTGAARDGRRGGARGPRDTQRPSRFLETAASSDRHATRTARRAQPADRLTNTLQF